MLVVEDLHTFHGWNYVLKAISFHVPRGSIVALVGANGAGKSTLLGTIAGIHRSARGKILVEGIPVQGLPAEKMVNRGIALVPEGRQIFDTLTVEENLLLGAYHRRRKFTKKALASEIQEVFNLFPALSCRHHDLAGALSGGMQQMLAIGRGLMARPKILLLDEPSLGLAPLVAKEIFRTIALLKQQGTSILLVEQNASAAMQLADWVYVLDQGKIVLNGAPETLKRDHRVKQAYLGKGYGSLAKAKSI